MNKDEASRLLDRLNKEAFVPSAPPVDPNMPPPGMPPVDPAMMGGGAPMPPMPVDPSMGGAPMPADPNMIGALPPIPPEQMTPALPPDATQAPAEEGAAEPGVVQLNLADLEAVVKKAVEEAVGKQTEGDKPASTKDSIEDLSNRITAIEDALAAALGPVSPEQMPPMPVDPSMGMPADMSAAPAQLPPEEVTAPNPLSPEALKVASDQSTEDMWREGMLAERAKKLKIMSVLDPE